MSDLIREAIAWAERGIPVFPCGSDKAPLTKRGFHDAESDPAKVRALFEFYGSSAQMIGGRMGDGVFAVDVDLYKGDAPKAWLKARIDAGEMPETRVHETKNGGLHFLYEGDVASCNPNEGVEIKGEGGYVIMPGSPGYAVKSEGISPAPPTLLSLIRASISNTRGSTDSQLRNAILSGSDFHNSLTILAARMAYKGMGQIEISRELNELLEQSTAKNVNHERHHRWRKIVADTGGELSRIAFTAYRKYSDDAIQEEAGEVADHIDMDDMEKLFKDVFTPLGNFEPSPNEVPEFNDDKWPFEGDGYYAHEEHDLTDTKFVMYPIYAEEETVVLFAEPKTGKTAIALTTALHIACGLDLGNFVVGSGGPCLYYALEGTRAIKLRVASWKKEAKERDFDLPDDIPLFVVERSTNFVKEDARKIAAGKIIAADRYCQKHNGAPLQAIFIDTLTKAMSGGDQNSVEDTSALFEIVNLVRAQGVKATIIFVHHKARTGNVRGSSNIEAEPDMLLDVSKEGEFISLRVARARSIEDGMSFHFELSDVDLGVTKQGHPLHGMFVSPVELTSPEDRTTDPKTIQLLAQRRKIVTQLGDECSAQDVVDAWFEAKLIKGKKLRTSEAAPDWSNPASQKALHEVAADAGGTIYGDFVIRPQVTNKQVTGFRVRPFT